MSHLVGAKLVADFGADGRFGGQVKKFSSAKGHLVKYDDGDEEWIKAILVSAELNLRLLFSTLHHVKLQKDPDIQITENSINSSKLPSSQMAPLGKALTALDEEESERNFNPTPERFSSPGTVTPPKLSKKNETKAIARTGKLYTKLYHRYNLARYFHTSHKANVYLYYP